MTAKVIASASRQAFSRVCQSGCSLILPPVRTGLVAPISSCSCSSAVVIASSDSSLSRICVASSGVSARSRQRSTSRCHCGWRFQTEIVSGATPISSAICLREWPCVCSKAARRARSEKLRRACGRGLWLAPAPPRWLAFDIRPFIGSAGPRQETEHASPWTSAVRRISLEDASQNESQTIVPIRAQTASPSQTITESGGETYRPCVTRPILEHRELVVGARPDVG